VLVLKQSSIKEHTLTISYSFSEVDGLKNPKNGHKRVAPLLPVVKEALLDLLKDNPHNIDDPFIFYSLIPNKPVSPNIILKGLKDAFEKINVDYKSRKIDFHSWRHFFCSKITQVLDGEKVARVSGHLSEAVFKKYADHIEVKQIQEVGEAAAETFGKILPFKKAS
jgi:integrase